MIKIILADDHQIFLDGLQAILKGEKDIVVEAEALNGEQVLAALKFSTVDILVLDIEMPGMSGIEITRKVREKYPEVKILMLTMHDKKDFIDQLLKLDVEGYILKNKGIEQLVQALRDIAKGGTYFGQEVMGALRPMKRKNVSEENVSLTKREEEVLRLIAKAYTSPEISKALFIAESTVETHRRNLIAKLGVKGTKGLVKWAVEKGLG